MYIAELNVEVFVQFKSIPPRSFWVAERVGLSVGAAGVGKLATEGSSCTIEIGRSLCIKYVLSSCSSAVILIKQFSSMLKFDILKVLFEKANLG